MPPPRPPEIVPEMADHEDEGTRMSFGDHLDELRGCLIRALLGLALAFALTLTFGQRILGLICQPLYSVQEANGLQARLLALSPTDAFAAYLKMSLLAGFILAMPWVFYQAWRFVAAGLYTHERRFVKRLTVASAGLFVAGVGFLYFLVLPVVLQFFISFNRAFDASGLTGGIFAEFISEPQPGEPPAEMPPGDTPPAERSSVPRSATTGPAMTIPMLLDDPPNPKPGETWINTRTKRLVTAWGDGGVWSTALQPGATAPAVDSQFAIAAYISFVLLLALAFGLAFETPIVVVFLAWSNLVPAETMRGARRYVIMIIVVLAAVITPTPDVISQLLLAVPMYGLFEFGLLLARGVERKRRSDPSRDR